VTRSLAPPLLLVGCLFCAAPLPAADESAGNAGAAAPAEWLDDPGIFPIAVWLQNPANATRYKAAGINLYVGLWKGPTEEQLADLTRHGMRVICSQNAVGMMHRDDPLIVGWMHGDEPDNAQSRRDGRGYDPPIPPARIVENYERLKQADPSRPVLLNLGQGVAWDGWYGRGVRTNHPEDYPDYVKGCDIASFDIYPACHDHADVAGKLWSVADGVTRLRNWAGEERRVWNCIECTRISNPNAKATPQQVKAEVWMSIVRGSRGIIYFVHQFKPEFIEAGLLADAEMLAEVTAVNQQIRILAPVLNSPTVADGIAVMSSEADVPVEAIVKRHDGAVYVFAVGMRDSTTTARFELSGVPAGSRVEVLGEARTIEARGGAFEDRFEAWDVHLYRIRAE
jgi:hypothetical protein